MKITIDGRTCDAQSGQTVLEVARTNGVYIPALCWHPRIGKAGRCRACVVEVVGMNGLKEACILEARDGMVVSNNSERVLQARRMIVNLLVSRDNFEEMMAGSNGENELYKMAESLGITKPSYIIEEKRLPLDETSEGIIFDPNVCIHCGRCVAACNNTVMHEVLDFGWRGSQIKVICDEDKPIGESTCVQCGECVQVCPVPALTFKNSKEVAGALDIEKKKVICPFCGVGCVIELGIKDNKWLWSMGVEENWEELPNKGMLCVKGRFGIDFVNHPERLTTPLIRKKGKLEEADWDEALDLVALEFRTIKEKYGPGALAVFSSAKATNEENYALNRFTRAVIGTNNIDHCSRLCHSSSVAALVETLGSGAMTNSMQEVTDSDVFLVIGANPTWNHPVFGGVLRNRVKRHGTKLIVADPRRNDMANCADIFLQLKNGTDVPLLMGMCHIIVRENWHDIEYIERHCEGWDAFKKSLEFYTPDEVCRTTWISEDILFEAAKLFATAGRSAVYWGMGITQHTHGTDNAKAIVNLALITGNIGYKGGGVNPLRGQNNVQGASDMGALPHVFTGYQDISDEEVRDKFASCWGVDTRKLDPNDGLALTQIIDLCGEQIKALYIVGENPLISEPNLDHAEKQMEKLDYLVVQDIFLTETAKLADIVLPGVAFAEKTGTFTNTERRVQLSRQALEPPGGARQDYEIIADIAKRLGDDKFPRTPEDLFEEMRTVTPLYYGMTYKRLEGKGLQWPCPSEDHAGTPFVHADGIERGKGLLSALAYRPPAEETDKEYPLVLNTGRLLYHWHTGSMTRRTRVLDGMVPDGYVELNFHDAEKYGIADGEMINLSSRRGSITIRANLTNRVAQGALFIPFHFAEAAANRLTNNVLDPVSKIPEYKVCAVRIEKFHGGSDQ